MIVLFHHLGAEDVGRHQIGRELDAAGIEAEHHAQRLDQLGLGEPGNADQQRVAAGEQRHQRALDHGLLAEDDAADAGADSGNVGQRLFGLGDHLLFADRRFLHHHAHAASSFLRGSAGRQRSRAATRQLAVPDFRT